MLATSDTANWGRRSQSERFRRTVKETLSPLPRSRSLGCGASVAALDRVTVFWANAANPIDCLLIKFAPLTSPITIEFLPLLCLCAQTLLQRGQWQLPVQMRVGR